MTDRDRLIHKIMSLNKPTISLQTAMDIVDAIIDEGVIVPPCKVGDYVKIEGIESFLQVESIHYYRNGLPKIGVTDGRIAITFTIIEKFEVFTKEEAEAKLKELNK